MKIKALRKTDNYQTTMHNEWSMLCNTKATGWLIIATQNAQSVELSYAWFSQIGSHILTGTCERCHIKNAVILLIKGIFHI